MHETMDENEPLCAPCGAACGAITGARADRWTLNPARRTVTGTVHLSAYDAIAMGTETQAVVVAVLRPDQLADVCRDFACHLPPCPLRRMQDRQPNRSCVRYPAGYDERG